MFVLVELKGTLGAEPAWGKGGSSPLSLGIPLEAKGKKDEERGKRRKKKREEEEGVLLMLGLALPLRNTLEREK